MLRVGPQGIRSEGTVAARRSKDLVNGHRPHNILIVAFMIRRGRK